MPNDAQLGKEKSKMVLLASNGYGSLISWLGKSSADKHTLPGGGGRII